MDIEKVQFDKAGEVLCTYEHSSGLKAFVIPKRGIQRNTLLLPPTTGQ